jgi:hypothetical protein
VAYTYLFAGLYCPVKISASCPGIGQRGADIPLIGLVTLVIRARPSRVHGEIEALLQRRPLGYLVVQDGFGHRGAARRVSYCPPPQPGVQLTRYYELVSMFHVSM